MINRRKTYNVKIGDIFIGSDYPIVIQSMTNTDTEDIIATVNQVVDLYKAGSEVVRLTVNTIKAGMAIKEIKLRLLDQGLNVPLVGDFHFNGHKILAEAPDCAIYLDKYRINPGNVGRGSKKDEHFSYMIKTAIEYDKPVRIGVNWGSLDQELLKNLLDENQKLSQPLSLDYVMQNALINSALLSADYARQIGLDPDKIIISCKVSKVQELINVYSRLANQCQYPLHIGLTEAGMGVKGIVSSSIALGNLLQYGIGDTIRVSLTPKPNESRTQEVVISKEILQSLGLRSFNPVVTSCPGCGRTSSDYFQHLAQDIQIYLDQKMLIWKNIYKGVETMKVAVMGCVVNGPGESKLANIGISLPGKDENPVAPVYIDGEKFITLKGNNITQDFVRIVEEYVIKKYT
jgi:(E)-4-hydroxy-3-methylbut-2-enyl-diphosphate synthase